MRTRLGSTISYKSLYFVKPSLELVPLFKGMWERSFGFQVRAHEKQQPLVWFILDYEYKNPTNCTSINVPFSLLQTPNVHLTSTKTFMLDSYCNKCLI